MISSIRTKLTVWYVAVLALIIISFAGLTYLLVVRVIRQETDETLREMARNLTTGMNAEYQEESAASPAEFSSDNVIAEVINESRFHDYVFTVYTADSRLVSSTAADTELNTGLLKNSSPEFAFETAPVGNEYYRVRQFPFVLGAEHFNLIVARSLADQERFLFRLRSILFVSVPVALFLTGLGGYFLARKSLAPVARMSERAATISAGNLYERLPVGNEKDELGKLAAIFNELLLRLENSFQQQRRFMADASHELRTPLAIVRGESEVALSKDDRAAGELRESLAIVHDESRRLTKIVEDLFTLARADAGQFGVKFGKIYLDELLADCVRAVNVLAKKRNITLELTLPAEMPFWGDDQLLRRLFINLLDNAIKYNYPGGKVIISGATDSSTCMILITDTGIGIDAGEKEKIFERFYRTDLARSRSEETITSGSGLGLSISRWIAEQHHGTIEIVSSGESGSVFAVSLPKQKLDKVSNH